MYSVKFWVVLNNRSLSKPWICDVLEVQGMHSYGSWSDWEDVF